MVKKFISLLLVFTLLLSTINISVFAASESTSVFDEYSLEKELSIKEKRLLELQVLDTVTKQYYSTSILLLPGAEWKESILYELDNRYLLVNYNYEYFIDEEVKPQIVVGPNGTIRLMAVETIFDIGMFTMSLAEFIANPTFWNGFWVVADGLSMVFPGIPAVSGVKRMIQGSSSLEKALKVGVMSYKDLQKKSIPSGWERHHIFEKRFQSRLPGATSDNMLAIPLSKENHNLFTQTMRKKIPYGSDYSSYTKDQILNAHINAYKELWNETGDPVWEFLYQFSKTKQYKAK